VANIVAHKTLGFKWYAKHIARWQGSCLWIGNRFEMPNVAYTFRCKPFKKRHSTVEMNSRNDMIKSKFIIDILDLLLDGDNDGLMIRQQLDYITDENYNYTGSGLFVKFSHSDSISTKRIQKDNLVLNGVLIKSSELEIGADAKVFITNGSIDYLEIWSQSGDYPKKELMDYILTQVWEGSTKRQVTKDK
jgi:hypothetical protein